MGFVAVTCVMFLYLRKFYLLFSKNGCLQRPV